MKLVDVLTGGSPANASFPVGAVVIADVFSRMNTIGTLIVRGWIKMDHIANIPSDLSGERLRDGLVSAFNQAGIESEVVIYEAGTGRMNWGVEWRVNERGGTLPVNMVNWTTGRKTVRPDSIRRSPS